MKSIAKCWNENLWIWCRKHLFLKPIHQNGEKENEVITWSWINPVIIIQETISKEHGIRKVFYYLSWQIWRSSLFARGNGSWYFVESQPRTQTSTQASTTSTQSGDNEFYSEMKKSEW